MSVRDRKPPESERILAEARRVVEGAALAPAVLIEAPDRELLRALRKAGDEDRQGLLKLFARVGGRGRRVAEQALAATGLDDRAMREVLAFLGERQPDHPLVQAWAALGTALQAGDVERARGALDRLPEPLAAVWVRAEGVRLLSPLAKGLEELLLADSKYAGLVFEALDKDTAAPVLEEIGSLFTRSGSRALQKAIRSAFFRLEQRGVKVPALAAGEGGTGIARDQPLAQRAFLTAVDPSGDYGVWVLEELPEGGYSCLQAILGDDGAIGEARASVLVRRGYEMLVRDLEKEREVPILEVRPGIAIGVLEETYAHNPAAASRHYVSWRQAQAADRRAERPALEPIAESEHAELVARSADLLESDACRHWHLLRGDTERAETMLKESESTLVLPEHESARRKEDALARAAETVFTGPARARLARRLEATGLHFHLRGDHRLERIARATAGALVSDPAAPTPPLLTGMIANSIELLGKVREQEKESKDIVEP